MHHEVLLNIIVLKAVILTADEAYIVIYKGDCILSQLSQAIIVNTVFPTSFHSKHEVELEGWIFCKANGLCHATDGPPTTGPAGPSTANFVPIDGPAGPSMATRSAIDGPAGPVVVGDHLRRDSSHEISSQTCNHFGGAHNHVAPTPCYNMCN